MNSTLCRYSIAIALLTVFNVTTGLANSKQLSIMTYNVENLFHPSDEQNGLGYIFDKKTKEWVESDTYDKKDLEFTPNSEAKEKICDKKSSSKKKAKCMTSWTMELYKKKIKQISQVIVESKEEFPDILGLVEVENEQTVKDLIEALEKKAKLKKGLLKYVFKDGYDRRGIDNAIIYKSKNSFLELTLDDQDEPKVKFLRLPAERLNSWQTRYIVEAEFEVFGKYKLFVFLCHWPAQREGATETFSIGRKEHIVQIDDELRLTMARMIRRRMDIHFKQNHDAYYIVTGDFNVIDSDVPHAIREGLLAKTDARKDLLLKVDKNQRDFSTVNTHKVLLEDVHRKYFRNRTILNKTKDLVPRGTYFYDRKMSWNLFDRFFTSLNLHAGRVPKCQKGLAVKTDSYKIHNNGPWAGTYTYHQPDEGEHRFALHVPFTGSQVTKTPLEFVQAIPYQHGDELGFSDHFPISMVLWDKGSGEKNCEPWEYYGIGIQD